MLPVEDALVVVSEKIGKRAYTAESVDDRLGREDDFLTHAVKSIPLRGVNQQFVEPDYDCEMQPTFKRLMDAAKELHGKTGPAEAGRLIDETEQTMTNWKNRGVPPAKFVSVSVILGCNPIWLATGAGPMRGLAPAAPPAQQISDAEAALLAAIRALPEDQQTLMLFDMKTKAERALLELQLSNRPAA